MARTSLLALLLLAALAAADERVDNIFRVWDTDGNGILDREEVPDADIFAKVDRDKNGKITRAEVGVYLGIAPAPAPEPEKKRPARKKPPERKSEAAPKKPPRTIPERVADFFRRFDKNKDKKIQRGEWQAGGDQFADWDRNRDDQLSEREVRRYIQSVITEAKKRPNPANFFDLFDRNNDGKVTKREYDGPSDFFRRYDHDRNRSVTRAELNMGPDAGRRMRGDEQLLREGPTREPRRGLLERYDTNDDGRITLEELGGAESILKRLDKNRDGVLSGSEVR